MERTDCCGTGEEKAVKIGRLRVFPPLFMAPMAGLTHTSFRRLLSELGGAGLFYTEMLSARALRHETPEKSRHLRGSGESRPFCLQIFASEPSQIAPAVERGELWRPDAWDLNLGCPAPEIVKQGAGSALLRNPARAREMAAAMRRAVDGPLLFKVRVQESRERTMAVLEMLEGEGADAVVVHARTAGERFGRPARWERLAGLSQRLSIPVIGNGDITGPEDPLRMLEATGCSGAMIGRAAVARPWTFRWAARYFGAKVPPLRFRTKSSVFLRMVELLQEELEPPRDLYRLKAFAVYFAKNFKFGHQLWKFINRTGTVEEASAEAMAFFRRNGDEDVLEG